MVRTKSDEFPAKGAIAKDNNKPIIATIAPMIPPFIQTGSFFQKFNFIILLLRQSNLHRKVDWFYFLSEGSHRYNIDAGLCIGFYSVFVYSARGFKNKVIV